MIIPSCRVQWISDQKGYGLFATQKIPKGTITFVQDPLDIAITPQQFSQFSAFIKPYIEKYSYESPAAEKIISWDNGKFMNHCCKANSLTTGYGFEIAVDDIEAGEEITDDYRIFSVHAQDMQLDCPKSPCQKMVDLNASDELIQYWDRKIEDALIFFLNVSQPLLPLVDESTLKEIKDYLQKNGRYQSVRRQIAKKPT